jgi:hypothetical protein
MYEYEENENEGICLACSVAGCDCDEVISGCESEQEAARDHALAQVEKTYTAYRACLDVDVRDYACPNLIAARQAYLGASDALMKL